MLSFRNDEDVDRVFSITDILGTRVEILSIRKNKLVPQCKKCQAYGHTQRYCAKQPRCVRCTGFHYTKDCDKPKDTQPRCIHCGKNHPANYRGCIVAKEIQKLSDKQAKKVSLPERPQRINQVSGNNKIDTRRKVQNIKSYSQAVSCKINENQERKDQNKQNLSVDSILQQILEKLNKLDEHISRLEYRVQGVIPKTRNG